MSRRLALLVPAIATLCGCLIGTGPRFPQNVQASFARDDMRRLTTRTMELYYPAARRVEALRIASRVEACVDFLRERTLATGDADGERLRIFLTSADFNNAYVQPTVPGFPQVMVLPEHVTLEIFNLFGLGPGEAADIGCHEAVHYVQLQQVTGFWSAINAITGGVLQPNAGTETWFLEGLATYYESRIHRRVGRPNSPLWRAMVQSGAASDLGDVDPAMLSPEHRLLEPFGGNYLMGSHFVGWLADRFGEKKLWELIERQGDSIFLTLGVTLRFQRVYGHDIGDLFDQFRAEYLAKFEEKERPVEQRVLEADAGYMVRLVSSRSGALATIGAGREQVDSLTIREPDGTVRFRRPITPIIPFRPYITAGAASISGMDFAPDEKSLFVMTTDLDAEGSSISRLLQFDATDGALIRTWDDLVGLGGSVTPDGSRYVFVQVERDTANLAALNLATGRIERLTNYTGRSSLGPPAVSPDGTRIAFSRWTGEGFDLHLREQDGSIRALTHDGHFNYGPRWIDADTLLFVRQPDADPKSGTQAFSYELATNTLQQITDAPWAVLDAMPQGKTIAFLNRVAWSWSLDTAPLAAKRPPAQTVEAQTTEAQTPAALARDTEPTRDDPESVEILADRPYSSLDGLLIPRYHSLTGLAVGNSGRNFFISAGAGIQGSDWLGFHNCVLAVDVANREQRGPGIFAQYLNTQLAPWFLSLTGSRTPSLSRTTLSGVFTASRSFWTTPVQFSLVGARLNALDANRTEARETQFIGPSIAASYFAGQSTPYGGLQRGLGFSGSAAFYPEAAESSFDLGDLRGTITGALPLPFSGRHNFTFALRGRYLPGAPRGLLRVGGFENPLAISLPESKRTFPISPVPLPGGFTFSESLRGYEDSAFGATRVAVGTASYRYRIIIDEGWSSFLGFLPSLLVQQLEVEAWGTVAYSDNQTPLFTGAERHAAAGGALFLRTTFGMALPVSAFYQYAYRFDGGLPALHTFGFALD